MPSIQDIGTWFFEQVEILYLMGIVCGLGICAWKRSIAGIVVVILVGIIIGIFVFNPEVFETIANKFKNSLNI